MAVHSLIYTSIASVPVTGDLLVDILGAAARRNLAAAVTGHLVYSVGAFVQELEGPERAVETIFRSISRDPRHREVRVLGRQVIAERDFPGWTMSVIRAGADNLVDLGLRGAADVHGSGPQPALPVATGGLDAGERSAVAGSLADHLTSLALAKALLREGPQALTQSSLSVGIDGPGWVFLRTNPLVPSTEQTTRRPGMAVRD